MDALPVLAAPYRRFREGDTVLREYPVHIRNAQPELIPGPVGVVTLVLPRGVRVLWSDARVSFMAYGYLRHAESNETGTAGQ